MSAIVVDKVTKVVAVGFLGRKKTLLSDVSLTVPEGATVGFVGANGAGKSTTIKHIIGASRPTSGTVRVYGADPRAAATRRNLGYMPELPQLPPTLNLGEVLHLHARLCSVQNADARVHELTELVGLKGELKSRVGTFSKGMQTRAGLALALLHDPKLLVLDEPMSGLDPVGRQLVRNVLKSERDRKKSILFSSHVLTDVEALCDHVVVISRGKIVFAGETATAVGAIEGWSIRVHAAAQPSGAGVVSAVRDGDGWLVHANGADPLAAAQSLRAAGAEVISVEPRRQRLEDRLVAWIGESTS